MMDESKCARCGHGPVLPNGLCLHCTEADGTTLARVNIELAALRGECEEQRLLLNEAVVKLADCYEDYKKYRKASEEKDTRIAELTAACEWAE